MNLTISFSLSKNIIYWKWPKKVDFEKSKNQIAILLVNQCSISAVFQIVRFAGDQKTALTGESLYFQITHAISEIWGNLLAKRLTTGKLPHISKMACRIWKWYEYDTSFHHQFYLKNASLTVITPMKHIFLVNGLNSLCCI